jgi:hypothetical protein
MSDHAELALLPVYEATDQPNHASAFSYPELLPDISKSDGMPC